MPTAKANGIDIAYETYGEPHNPAVLLINGLGSQMTRWPNAFCEMVAAAGHHVIRFDNRDVGLSTWFKAGDHYRLEDMAADAVGLLDALKIKAAHVAGVSMGGMIGQVVAADHPERTLSLTSIMSSSGAPNLPQSTPEAMAVLTTPAPDPKADPTGEGRGRARLQPGGDRPPDARRRRHRRPHRTAEVDQGAGHRPARLR
jgi:pimeloyl-ACP methyl ester carboxylesterase